MDVYIPAFSVSALLEGERLAWCPSCFTSGGDSDTFSLRSGDPRNGEEDVEISFVLTVNSDPSIVQSSLYPLLRS
jgi:hypothetical protein